MGIYSKLLLFFYLLQLNVGQTSAFFVGVTNRASATTVLMSAPMAERPPDIPGGLTKADVQAASFQSLAKENFYSLDPTLVQGNSLRTFKLHPNAGRAQVLLTTEGRPLHSKVELWHGPDYTPMILNVYLENGLLYPFNAVLETPYQNTVGVYNTANMEFPLSACVEVERDGTLQAVKSRLYESSVPEIIQGGALKTFSFASAVESVQIYLKTDGRHLKSKIELLQGPNNIKQTIDIYGSDGKKRPFFTVVETPGTGNVIRIINTGPLEYPIEVYVEPFMVGSDIV